ncbi:MULTISPECIES: H-NS family nucleoid-associated regulatory protein [unclassified Cupriavidus]|uniref:H-NS family nucleoid-associated regulatory protein n=1 Tax=unclassified Cupriavidus TaxID=2640874 RepID=UPI0010F68E45|nr:MULTISPECIES: H-NS family nucleoid-associated regulatory protein [unclassified Cupriavidus]MWL89848.1 H-NS histone family protein [Cupriavidus sp. SW-Y-13]
MSESEAAKTVAVAWVREQMDRHGLTFDHLVEAGCFAESEETAEVEVEGETTPATPAPAAAPRVVYRNAMGQTWDGTGEYPDWLQRAVNAGQSIDFYRVE